MQLKEGASQEGRGRKAQARTLRLLGRAGAWSEWRSRQLAQAQSGPET